MLCSVLRERGVAARPRCGFASYIATTHWMDHWVCEYWDPAARRWVMEDPDFETSAVPASRFYTGLHAWEISRKRPDMADRFGFSPDPSERGTWAARTNMVRDLAALNGFVSVSADTWGLASVKDEELTPEQLAALDEAAAGADNAGFERMRALYETFPGFKPGPVIHHFDYLVTKEESEVCWEEE